MLPEFERTPKGQKRGGKGRSRRASMHNIPEYPRAQEGWNCEVVDNRSRNLREVEGMRDAVEMELLPGFEDFSTGFFGDEHFLSERTLPEVWEELNDVLHPGSNNKDAEISHWIESTRTPYFFDDGGSSSASRQVYTGSVLNSEGRFETIERRVKKSKDIHYDYSADFVEDINTAIAECSSRRRKVSQLQHRYEREQQEDLVPDMEALTISKAPRGQRRRSTSVGARDASEYKQPRGIRKSKR
ncbi:hypothetical protein TWF506_008071 [Arthrobotrys conoides]|uniref:Uncharacterized protein n=1 Tax=Arthrobotrys conoides TaxID=74498 RepID=A0AAN8RXW7_9PEZI